MTFAQTRNRGLNLLTAEERKRHVPWYQGAKHTADSSARANAIELRAKAAIAKRLTRKNDAERTALKLAKSEKKRAENEILIQQRTAARNERNARARARLARVRAIFN
jgi:hypothetical protein